MGLPRSWGNGDEASAAVLRSRDYRPGAASVKNKSGAGAAGCEGEDSMLHSPAITPWIAVIRGGVGHTATAPLPGMAQHTTGRSGATGTQRSEEHTSELQSRL